MDCEASSIVVGDRPGWPAALLRPEGEPQALVLHLHGGAFTDGVPACGCTVARLLADAGATVVSLDYPLAPEHPFPAPAEAAHAALAWMARHRRRLGAAQAPLAVAGEEAGGNLAAAAALMARDRAGPELEGQILLSPMLDTCVATASARRAHAGPVGCRWADGWRRYLSQACDATHPYAAPGSSLRLAGLPATLLVTAVDDLLCDETRAYARRLRDAGVPVHEAVLPLATGWPASYRHDPATAPAWAQPLTEQLRRFIASLQDKRTPA
jgi:acetyl esterase/lipase